MNCQQFDTLPWDDQIDYIYHSCELIDFDIVSERYRQYGLCLYHNGDIFVEVRFDGLQGHKIREIKVYEDAQQLHRWYERINLNKMLSETFEG